MVRVAHLTSVHARDDTRIFIKQCKSLAADGFDVTLVVADGRGNASHAGVGIIDAGSATGRFDRMRRVTGLVLAEAVRLDADIYHLHDPELIPAGLKLKRLGKTVIFDAHEDVPGQLLGKSYLWAPARRLAAAAFSAFERRACPRFDAIIAATPAIREKFLPMNPRTIDINNFPVQGELDDPVPWQEKREEVCYAGVLSASRGARELVLACERFRSGAKVNLVGRFAEPGIERELKTYRGWSRVRQWGMLGREELRGVLTRSFAGIVAFHSAPNHDNAQPNKMFEYMSAGIPVIASDFPLWREIVVGGGCGLCINPRDPGQIAQAVDWLIANPDLARQMGENGRRAVMSRYNWAFEERKLQALYRMLAARRKRRQS